MESHKLTIHNVTTGETIEREFTNEELAQRQIDLSAAAEAAAIAEQNAQATAAAIAHAKSLGFTDEMIAVMYPALSAL